MAGGAGGGGVYRTYPESKHTMTKSTCHCRDPRKLKNPQKMRLLELTQNRKGYHTKKQLDVNLHEKKYKTRAIVLAIYKYKKKLVTRLPNFPDRRIRYVFFLKISSQTKK